MPDCRDFDRFFSKSILFFRINRSSWSEKTFNFINRSSRDTFLSLGFRAFPHTSRESAISVGIDIVIVVMVSDHVNNKWWNANESQGCCYLRYSTISILWMIDNRCKNMLVCLGARIDIVMFCWDCVGSGAGSLWFLLFWIASWLRCSQRWDSGGRFYYDGFRTWYDTRQFCIADLMDCSLALSLDVPVLISRSTTRSHLPVLRPSNTR